MASVNGSEATFKVKLTPKLSFKPAMKSIIIHIKISPKNSLKNYLFTGNHNYLSKNNENV